MNNDTSGFSLDSESPFAEGIRVNRRTLLKGVTAGSIVPATHVGTAQFDESDDSADSDDGRAADGGRRVTVRIVDLPDTVRGGDLLEWAVAVENRTDRPVRPSLEFFVDGESRVTVETTVEPGETKRTSPGGFRTEPVANEREMTVRVETSGDSDAGTVRVLGVDDVAADLRFPDRQLTVQSGTEVHFEVGAVDPDARQETSWWVDGEHVGDSFGPWPGMFYGSEGAHYWQETFEDEGDHTVVAGIESGGERYRASWDVTVAPDGLAEPTIEAARPAPGILEVERGDTLDFELEVADPDGNLDRVVWWLTQSDALLDVTDVAGAEDTAAITVDGFCHTCEIVAWVITGDGTVATEAVWQFDVAGVGRDLEADGGDEPDGGNRTGDGAETGTDESTTGGSDTGTASDDGTDANSTTATGTDPASSERSKRRKSDSAGSDCST